jgi:hypothetical protein
VAARLQILLEALGERPMLVMAVAEEDSAHRGSRLLQRPSPRAILSAPLQAARNACDPERREDARASPQTVMRLRGRRIVKKFQVVASSARM